MNIVILIACDRIDILLPNFILKKGDSDYF